MPVGIDVDRRERLEFVAGDVATSPYPAWAAADSALESIARLTRGLHDSSVGVDVPGATWSDEMADPHGGPVICHNDVCIENVVFRDGQAVALSDFDYAAPGRRGFDVAAFARMCVPVDDDISAAQLGWPPMDPVADGARRLRLICDTYGFTVEGRQEVLSCLSESIARGGEFICRPVEAGESASIEMSEPMGGLSRFDRRRSWWASVYPDFAAALGLGR